jgi:tRNA A37 threonylcarbamoyladenosine dehydratase
VRGDALLSSVRARLRRTYGFSRQAGVPFGVPAIHSEETLVSPAEQAACAPPTSGAANGSENGPGSPLACGGYGSSVAVTAAMGMAAASVILSALLSGRGR